MAPVDLAWAVRPAGGDGSATLADVAPVSVPVRRLIGWVCIVVGVVALVLGYAGVDGTSIVAKQLPYLISGGLFGVTLVVVGTALVGRRSPGKGSERLDYVERALREVTAVLITRAAKDGPSEGDS